MKIPPICPKCGKLDLTLLHELSHVLIDTTDEEAWTLSYHARKELNPRSLLSLAEGLALAERDYKKKGQQKGTWI